MRKSLITHTKSRIACKISLKAYLTSLQAQSVENEHKKTASSQRKEAALHLHIKKASVATSLR